jgi:ABC-type multidrug transport system fused ATPase/permease subunit
MADTRKVIEVELPRTPRKVKSSVQQRLENSPARTVATPERLQVRLERAEQKRQKELNGRLQHAISHNADVKCRAAELRERRQRIIEIPVKKATPKRKPAVQSRLEKLVFFFFVAMLVACETCVCGLCTLHVSVYRCLSWLYLSVYVPVFMLVPALNAFVAW